MNTLLFDSAVSHCVLFNACAIALSQILFFKFHTLQLTLEVNVNALNKVTPFNSV